MRSVARTLALVAVCTALAAVTLGGGRPATAGGIDLTGTWSFQISGDFGFPLGETTLHCTAPLTQQGDEATGDFDCGIATGEATATITDQALGADIEADVQLDVSFIGDIDAQVVGTISPNGNYMEGDWDADSYEGTFTAERESAQFLNGDLNCDTSINALDGLLAVLHAASAAVTQYPGCPELGSDFASVFGDVNCDDEVDQVDALWLLRYEGGIPLGAAGGCAAIGALVQAD